MLARAITRFAKRSPGELDADIAAGLDFHDLAAAFRPSTGPKKIAGRIAAAAASARGSGDADERLPDFATAVEFGKEAHAWGLRLAQELKNALPWEDMLKGICLGGPPGTGKSIYPKSLGRFCGIPVLVTKVPDWFVKERSYLADVIRAVRATFDQAAALARANASGCCILALDEVDAIPNRATLDSRNRDFWLPILAEILVRLDCGSISSSARTGVIVISSTNRPEGIDSALLRPGRLERLVIVEPPDAAGIRNILKFHVGGDLADDDFADVGHLMERATAAECMQLVRDARSIARLAGRPLAADDLKAALLETGSHDTSVEARICVHEAGHATMALALSYGTLRHALVGAKVGIRNRTLIDAGDPNFATLKDIEDRATVLLAGRSAEREICNSISLGSGGDESSDVGQATIAMAAARSSYCIAGDIAFQGRPNEVAEAIRYDRQLRDEVEADLQRLQKRADDLIAKHRGAVLAIADALRTRRHVDGKELRRIFDAAAATRAVTRARGAAE